MDSTPLPPLNPAIFEMTLQERMAQSGLENTQDIEALRKIAIGCYRRGLVDAKLVKHLLATVAR